MSTSPKKRSRTDRIAMYSMCGAIICGTIAGVLASSLMPQNRWMGFCVGYVVGGVVGWMIGLGVASRGRSSK